MDSGYGSGEMMRLSKRWGNGREEKIGGKAGKMVVDEKFWW
jgi:hypothetical protein